MFAKLFSYMSCFFGHWLFYLCALCVPCERLFLTEYTEVTGYIYSWFFSLAIGFFTSVYPVRAFLFIQPGSKITSIDKLVYSYYIISTCHRSIRGPNHIIYKHRGIRQCQFMSINAMIAEKLLRYF